MKQDERHLAPNDIFVGIDLATRQHQVVVLDLEGRRKTSFKTTTIWPSLNRDFLIPCLLTDYENSRRFPVQLSGDASVQDQNREQPRMIHLVRNWPQH